MESSASNSPIDLLELYKSPEVSRISTFGDVAGRLDPGDLVAAYVSLRNSAPRRHERKKSYFVDHAGLSSRSDNSNRREEHLALALWGESQTGASMVLPTGATLEILDYQTPLKARQSDKGVGKVDLFGLLDGCRLTVIELKIRPATSGYGDTPLRAYLEALAYCAIVEANASDIASEASTRFNKPIDDRPPAFVITNGGDSEKSSPTITVENTDVSRVQTKKASEFGSSLVFRGELSADEEILIQGTVEGTIVHHKKTLIVGKDGRVKGLIHANFVTIEGQVDGDIHGDVMVRLTGSADVSGDIYCARISMADGARFNGTMYMR